MEIKDLNLSSHSQYWGRIKKDGGTRVIQKDKMEGNKRMFNSKELFMSFKTKDKFKNF